MEEILKKQVNVRTFFVCNQCFIKIHLYLIAFFMMQLNMPHASTSFTNKKIQSAKNIYVSQLARKCTKKFSIHDIII